MTHTKSAWQSRTVIAAMIGFIAVLLDLFGVQLGDQDQLTDAVMKIIEGVAFLSALWGRLVATARLT